MGWGVEENPEEAIKLYGLAIRQGITLAVGGFSTYANKGYASAQYELGYCYENGLGVKKNPEEAAKFYKLAADKGHDGAKTALVATGKVSGAYATPVQETAKIQQMS